MKYDAFISYRHSELDMEIAKKVHTGLETYHVPRAARKKLEKKKIKRVFRDQEELPIGSDLNDNISSALKESEYLIVICSPRTPESYWVCKEIESFIEMHDRDHILAVLIEGEPNESFPPLLLTDEKGNPVEPLAADVRGETAKERNKKFKTEILRLAAPVLGCSYDDLKQRHRERIIRRTITFVSAGAAIIAAAGAAFGIYNANVAAKMKQLADEKAQLADEKSQLADEKTQLAEEILAEYKDKQENQSRFYAEKALSLIKQGYREDAVLVAKEGLPYEGNDRPYVPEAEYALSKALSAYDGASSYAFDRVLKHDMLVTDVKVNNERTFVSTSDSGGNVWVWDTSDWSVKTKIPFELSEDNTFIPVIDFYAYEDGVCVLRENALVKYDFDGNELYRIEAQKEFVKGTFSESAGLAVVYYRQIKEDEDVFSVIFSDQTYIGEVISVKDGSVVTSYELPYEPLLQRYLKFANEGKVIITGDGASTIDEEDNVSYIDIYDIESGELNRVKLSERYFGDIFVTYDGYICVTTYEEEYLNYTDERHVGIDVFDPSGKNLLWSGNVAVEYNSYRFSTLIVKSSTYKKDGKDFTGIIVCYGYNMYVFDSQTGELVNHIDLPNDVKSFVCFKDYSTVLLAYSDGSLQYLDVNAGTFDDNTLHMDKSLSGLYPCKYSVIALPTRSSELFVLSKLRAPDLEEVTKTDVRQYPMANSQKNDYFITMCFENDTYYFYDKDGNLLYTYDGFATVNPKDSEFIGNKLVYADFESLHIVDPYEKTAESYDWGNYFNGAYTTVDGVYISKSGKYLAAWDLCNVVVFDVETMEEIYHWNYDYTREGDQYAREAAVTDDGKTVLIIFDDGVIYHVDTQDEELIPYDSKELQVVREQHQFDKMTMSNDGKTAAILCMDEVVRVIDVQSGEVIDSMPLLAQYDLYMEFSDDGRCLLTQGDDLVLRIRDIESKSYIGDFEVGYSISYLIDDDADGLMAVVSSYNIWLLEKETYKVVAETTYTSKGSYFPETNSFLLADSAGIYKIGYKDYKQLLELAEKDFPGLELTPEQKKKYNID